MVQKFNSVPYGKKLDLESSRLLYKSKNTKVMARITITSIGAGRKGDRFYLKNDRKKEVWEKVDFPPIKTPYQTYSNFAITDNMLQMRYPEPKAFKDETGVVFLRHSYIQLELPLNKIPK